MAKSRWKQMSDEQKRKHLDRERERRTHLTDEQKQRRKEHNRCCRIKRRENGKALLVEQEYRTTGKGYFFNWANTIRARAKRKNLPCNIDADFLESIYTTHCPILGVKFERGTGKGFAGPFSPTVDRNIPERGYVKDNVLIISKRANQIKSDASIQEIKMVVEFYDVHSLRPSRARSSNL